MTKPEIATIAGWFILAAYVMWRCFTTTNVVGYDILFAAWLGGVESLAVVWVIVRRRRRAHRADA